jgi:hypothetical protein
MVVADGVAIWVGRMTGKRVIRYTAAVVFAISGLATIGDVLLDAGML